MNGEFEHNVDAKGRLIFPAKLRENLGDKFVVAKGLDDCLYVYALTDWAVFEENILALPVAKSRKMNRFFCASATECEPDGQGRILLPQALRDYAGIKREVVVLGLKGHSEIWDAERWKAYNEDMTSGSIAAIMEELGF